MRKRNKNSLPSLSKVFNDPLVYSSCDRIILLLNLLEEYPDNEYIQDQISRMIMMINTHVEEKSLEHLSAEEAEAFLALWRANVEDSVPHFLLNAYINVFVNWDRSNRNGV